MSVRWNVCNDNYVVLKISNLLPPQVYGAITLSFMVLLSRLLSPLFASFTLYSLLNLSFLHSLRLLFCPICLGVKHEEAHSCECGQGQCQISIAACQYPSPHSVSSSQTGHRRQVTAFHNNNTRSGSGEGRESTCKYKQERHSPKPVSAEEKECDHRDAGRIMRIFGPKGFWKPNPICKVIRGKFSNYLPRRAIFGQDAWIGY